MNDIVKRTIHSEIQTERYGFLTTFDISRVLCSKVTVTVYLIELALLHARLL